MLLVTFDIRTVCTNDEWEDESGEESRADGNFFAESYCLVDKSLKDYEADEQKFSEMILKEAYNTDNTMKPHYFFPFDCGDHISEPDDWDWESKPDGLLTERENCIYCSYPVLLKRGAESTLEIVVGSVESISWTRRCLYLLERVFGLIPIICTIYPNKNWIPRLDLTGYDNLSKSEVYTKYYNEENKKNDS
jgi:hypothetical protein